MFCMNGIKRKPALQDETGDCFRCLLLMFYWDYFKIVVAHVCISVWINVRLFSIESPSLAIKLEIALSRTGKYVIGEFVYLANN